jgi:hypothetical protein
MTLSDWISFFVQSTMPLNKHQVKRLNQMGATVRNSSIFLEKLETNKHKQSFARTMLEGMHMHEVQETLDFYKMMVDVASSVLEQKRQV